MKKEDCKVGLEVIVNYPGNYKDNCTGNVVGMGADKVSVAIQCFGGKVWDFAYSNIEPYGNQSAKSFFQVGDLVMICQRDHEAYGCFGIITKELPKQAVVKVDYGDKVANYYIEYENLNRVSRRDYVECQRENKGESPHKSKYVKKEITKAGYERLNDMRTKYRLFDNDYCYIGSIEAAKEFCEAVIMCTQYGLNMDDEDDDFITEICQELDMDDMLVDIYARKTGTKERKGSL